MYVTRKEWKDGLYDMLCAKIDGGEVCKKETVTVVQKTRSL